MKKIGLWGYYGHHNFGDDMLLELLLVKLDKYEQEKQIYVFCKDEIREHNNVLSVPRTIKNTLLYAMKLDVLIVGPGGLLPNRDVMKVIFFLLVAIIMRVRGKKFGIYGMGIGIANFRKKYICRILKLLFKVAKPIILRHELQEGLFGKDYKRTEVVETYDFLLSNHSLFQMKEERTEKNKIIFSLANIFPDNCDEVLRQTFLTNIECFIKELIQKDYSVTLIAFSGAKDAVLNSEICQAVGSSRCKCVTYISENQKEVLTEFREARLIIAMRFHALVLALQYGKSVYSIAYSEKLEDLCERFDLADFCQKVCFSLNQYYESIIELDAMNMKKQIDYLLEHEEGVSSQIKKKVSLVQEKITLNYDKGLEYLLS